MKLKLLCLLVLLCNNYCSQDYYSDRLFIKFKDNAKTELSREAIIYNFIKKENVKEYGKAFRSKEMSSVYLLALNRNDDKLLDRLITALSEATYIEYAERVPIYKLFYTPNDPMYTSQWNLAKIQANLAWNLGQGCNQVKIAVTDDGFLLNHEDLTNQWHINTSEFPPNGSDDDGNGYIDDWRGWDAADGDNDPSAVSPTNSNWTHGTHVAGIIAAQTNNTTGIASIGFNCKLIPVKNTNASPWVTHGRKSVEYAIAINADVINMSWGGGGKSITDSLLFALAHSKGIICVAAAGNNNTSSPMYPASYNHVISVAASDNSDSRASFSNYGSTIDVTAPGVGILSCLAGATNSYGNLSGTSMASPLVAGLCALMKCYNPMPADSIEACLKRTCDNINTQNPSYIGKLGAGRVNAYQALQCLTKKPKSVFIAFDTFRCIGDSVRFIAKSFGVPTLTYNWSFPGGSPATSTAANPVVTYSTNGYKSATLITCNSLGCDTITKSNIVNIDTPKAWLTNRKYTSYNANPVIITVNFKGNPPYSVTLSDGTNNFTQNNIRSNPYFFSIVPQKDTSYITISSFSDSLCTGNKYGKDTIYRITYGAGGMQYCESSFKFNGTPTNTVVKIDPQNGAAWKDLYSTNGFTWECWFNLGNRSSTSITGTESIVTASDAQLCEDLGFIFNMPWSGGTGLGWVVSGQTGCSAPKGVVATTMSLNANTWYHAAGVMDYSTNTMRLYVNGTQVNSGTLNIPLAQRMKNNVAVTIGNQDVNYNPYSGGFTPFKGMVDDVRFWNVVRTPAEILANYKTCLPKTTPNLVAYFKADEGTGTATNSLINGNFVGTLQNSATWGTQVDSVKNCTSCDTTITITLKTSDLCAFDGDVSDYNASLWEFNRSYLIAGNWTIGGSPYKWESVLKFDMKSIPANATINSAYLSLYADKLATGWGITGKPTYSSTPDNSVYIRRVINNFTKNTPQNFPVAYTTTNQILIPASTSDTQSYPNIDIKGLVQDIVNSNQNNGILIEPRYSNVYNSFVMCSGNNSNVSKHPKLVVSYTINKQDLIGDNCDTCALNDGLVLNLPFNGNTNDISGNNNHATNYGATSVAGKSGVANTAYRFDSLNYMSVNHHSNLNLRSFTLTAILKPLKFNTDICYTNCVLSKGTASVGAHWALQYAPTTSTTCFNRDTTNCNMFLCGSVCPPSNSVTNTLPYMFHNNWECAVVTYDSVTKEVKLYMNGVLRHQWAATFSSLTSQNAMNVLIGKYGDPNYPGYFQGVIDDIRIYSRVLTPSEVKGYCGTCNNIPSPQSDCDTTNLNTGLLAYYKLDGNVADSSGQNKHGTAIGGITYSTGKKGQAAYFDGIDDYIQTNAKILKNQANFSVAGWLKLDQATVNNKMFNIYRENNSGWYGQGIDISLGKFGTNNYMQIEGTWCRNLGAGMFPYATFSDTISTGIWHCFALTRANDSLKLYINGNLVDKKPNNFLDTPLINGILGGWYFNNDPNQSGFKSGYLDDIRFYNRTLTPSEVKGYCGTCNMLPPPQPPCDTTGLVLCMSMNGHTLDSTKYNNHGTINGGVNSSTDRFGNTNGAYSFNGTSGYIEVPDANSLKLTNELTISLWIKQNSVSTNGMRFIDKISATTNDGYLFDCYGHPTNSTNRGKTPRFVSKDVNWSSTKSPYSIGVWNHLAVTYKNGLTTYYINGVYDTSYQDATSILNTNNLPLRIGASNPLSSSVYYNGTMDDIKIYSRALSSSEISNLYTKPFSCSCSSSISLPCTKSQKTTINKCKDIATGITARQGTKYQWSPASSLSSDTVRNPIVSVNTNQTYMVLYTDTANCQVLDTFDIIIKPSVLYPTISDETICIGDSVQLSIPIKATGVIWTPNTNISSTSSANPFVFPTANTTYYLQFFDSLGCVQYDTVQIYTKVCCPARARFSIPKEILCFGETLTIMNTSKGVINSYNWDFGNANPSSHNGSTPPNLIFPTGGLYPIRLIVGNGSCYDTMIKNVNVVDIKPYAGKDTNNCLGAFSVQLGDYPISDWTYRWTPTTYLNDPLLANPTCTIINDSINYIVEATDIVSGCKGYDTVLVFTSRNIISKTNNIRICNGTSYLFYGVNYTTAGTYYKTIKKADGICDSFIDVLNLSVLTPIINNNIPIIKCEYYIDAKGKRHDTTYIQRDTIRSKTINCDSIINITSIEIFKKSYRSRTITGCSPLRYNGKTYYNSVAKIDSLVTRGPYSGCDSIITTVDIVVYPKPNAIITASKPNPIGYKDTLTLAASGGGTYLWLPLYHTDSVLSLTAANIDPVKYIVWVTNEYNCKDSAEYELKTRISDTCEFGFPNAFSPNGDNLNDIFIPNLARCAELKYFVIFDRWGEKVFETDKYEGWTGFYRNEPALLGVYIYYAEINTPRGIRESKGNFTLVR